MTKKIWIVYGKTGEYADYREWTVCAYNDEKSAENHAQAALEWYQQNGGINLRCYYGKNPYDKDMSVDYTGTEWGIYSIDLVDKFERVNNEQDN